MRPQVVAHRGSSAANAEHTLGAYLAALQEGADALECDVRLTADGHLVCLHDRDLLRTAHREGLISTLDLADLDRLDFAAWKYPVADPEETDERDVELGRVLTLRRLLETVAGLDRRVELAIETKHPTRYGGLVERRLVECLGEFGWLGADAPVRIMSFSLTALHRMARLAPDLPMVLLLEGTRSWTMLRRMADPGWILGPGIEELTALPALAERLRATDRRVHVWTVNTRAQLALCRDLGVEAVITDKPAYIRRLVDAEQCPDSDRIDP